MADVINVGTTDNDGTGDTLRAAFTQINARFNELLGTIEGGDAWATGVAYTATPVRQWVINAGQAYVAAVNHVSGASFAADLSAGKWFAVDSAQLRADLLAPSGSSIVGYTPAGTGAVATTVQSKLRESVSVKDFGAVGDGVTDDYAKIMLAHDALPATGGQIILGRGSYLHLTPLVFTKRIQLIGEVANYVNGSSVSEFVKGSSVSGNGITILGGGSTLENFAYRGQVGNVGDGIVIKSGRVTLRDISVYAMGYDGIRIGTDAGGENCNLWFFENVRSKNNGHDGILISEGSGGMADANGGTMIHADLQGNASTGLNIGNAQLNTFVGVTSQTNGNYGIRLSNDAAYNTFYGGDWEGSGVKDLRIEAFSANNYISNYTFAANRISTAAPTGANRIETGTVNQIMSGLTFPATPVLSSDPSTLDEYFEIDFSSTVDVVGVTTSGAATFTTRSATATKIGNRVHVNMTLAWSAHTGTGGIRVTGLPYTANATRGRTAFCIASNNLTYGAGIPIGYIENSTSQIDLYIQASGVATAVIAIDTSATLYISCTYQAA